MKLRSHEISCPCRCGTCTSHFTMTAHKFGVEVTLGNDIDSIGIDLNRDDMLFLSHWLTVQLAKGG